MCDDGSSCTKYLKGAVFTLNSLSSSNEYITDVSNKYKPGYQLEYNICKFTRNVCKDTRAYANLFNKSDQQDCVRLTSNQVLSNQDSELIDNDDPSKGIKLIYTNGDSVDDKNYSFELILQCNKKLDFQESETQYNNDLKRFYVTIQSKQACPKVELGNLYKFIMDNKFIFFPIFFIVGLLFALYGLKWAKFTFFLSGLLLGFSLIMLLCFDAFLNRDSQESIKWVCFFVSIMIGIVTGYLTVRLQKVGLFVIGGWLGYFVSLLLYQAFLYKIKSNPESLTLYLTNAFSILIFGFLSFILYNQIIILSTSLGGSFFAIYSIGILAGKFPNLYSIAQKIQYHEVDSIEWQSYVYLCTILILFVLTSCYQFKQKYQREKKQKYNDLYDNDEDRVYLRIDRKK